MTSNQTDNSKKKAAVSGIDDQLLADSLAGSQQARCRLYESTHELVYRLMVRMVGLQEASDLTQQVYLKLFARLDQFAGHSKFETWLYRVATNEALQFLRKNSRKKTITLNDDPMSPHQPENERKEQRELLQVALNRTDPELRSIFLLKEVENLSYREIAEIVEIPEGTVGSRLNRARRELQVLLVELGWEGLK